MEKVRSSQFGSSQFKVQEFTIKEFIVLIAGVQGLRATSNFKPHNFKLSHNFKPHNFKLFFSQLAL